MGKIRAPAPPAQQQQQIVVVSNKDSLRNLLEAPAFKENLGLVASKYLNPERVIRVAMLAASRQPKLFNCTPASFLGSVIKAAEAGLDFGGVSGQGYLVPYRNRYLSGRAGREVFECQFVPGYQGFIELAYRSGRVTYIDAQLVYEADTFDYELGSDPWIKHKPSLATDRGPVKAAYAVAFLTDSTRPKVEIMAVADLEAIRSRSKAKDDGPWVTDAGEMFRKCPVRRIWKYLPKTQEVIAAIDADNAQFDTGGVATNLLNQAPGVEGCRERMAAAVAPPAPAGSPPPSASPDDQPETFEEAPIDELPY